MVTIRRLERMREQREDFLRAVSHDLRNPLQVVLLQADRISRAAPELVALRRPESPYETVRLPLRGLDPAARYKFTDLDTNRRSEHSGRDLLQTGLPILLDRRPGSCAQTYERQ